MKMKIWNIKDGKRLFERLSGCRGSVELVNEAGLHLTVLDGKTSPELLPMTYIDGSIRSMEVVFERREDAVSILRYLVGAREPAI